MSSHRDAIGWWPFATTQVAFPATAQAADTLEPCTVRFASVDKEGTGTLATARLIDCPVCGVYEITKSAEPLIENASKADRKEALAWAKGHCELLPRPFISMICFKRN
jgi:hypothetical protein